MKRAQKGLSFLLLIFFLLPFLYFVIPIGSEPSDVSDIDVLAPAQLVAEGFRGPTGIAVDSSGVIFVSDREAGYLFKISEGEVHLLITDLKRPVGLSFDGEGGLLIVEEKAGRLFRLESGGTLTPLAQGMRKPRWVAVAEDGTIFLTAKGLRSARDRDDEDEDEEQGEVILRLSPSGELGLWVDGFKGLQGIVVHEETVFAVAKGVKKDKNEHGDSLRFPFSLMALQVQLQG